MYRFNKEAFPPIGLPNVVNNAMCFSADDGIHGHEPWKTDGTLAGTVPLRDIHEGPGSSNPGRFAQAGGPIFFRAGEPTHGGELWVIDQGASSDDRNLDGVIDVKDLDAIRAALAAGNAPREDVEGLDSAEVGPWRFELRSLV